MMCIFAVAPFLHQAKGRLGYIYRAGFFKFGLGLNQSEALYLLSHGTVLWILL